LTQCSLFSKNNKAYTGALDINYYNACIRRTAACSQMGRGAKQEVEQNAIIQNNQYLAK